MHFVYIPAARSSGCQRLSRNHKALSNIVRSVHNPPLTTTTHRSFSICCHACMYSPTPATSFPRPLLFVRSFDDGFNQFRTADSARQFRKVLNSAMGAVIESRLYKMYAILPSPKIDVSTASPHVCVVRLISCSTVPVGSTLDIFWDMELYESSRFDACEERRRE